LKHKKIFEPLRQLIKLIATVTDNWVYLVKIQVCPCRNEQHDYLVSQVNSVTTSIVLAMDFAEMIVRIYLEWQASID
jgi:hypothetical protein